MRAYTQRLTAFDPRVLGWAAAAALGSAALGLLVTEQPAAAFDLGLVAVCAALIAWRPFAALLFLLLVRGGVATSPSGALFDFLTLTAGGLAVLLCARSLPGRRVIIPFLAFLLLALPFVPLLPSWDEGAKTLWLDFPVLHVQYLRTPSNEMLSFVRFAAGLAVFAWAAWAVRTPKQLTIVIGAVLAAAAYPVIVGLEQVASGRTHVRSNGFGSAVGPFSHPNGFASFLLIVMVIAVVAFIHSRSLGQRVALGLLLGGGLVCLLFTYTRASWVGFAIAILLLGLVRYRRLLVVGLIAVALAALAAPGATKKAEERFSDLSSSSQSYSRNSWSWRTKQWSRMLPYGLERPVLGRGYGGYERGTLAVFGTDDPQFGTQPRTENGSLGFGAHNDFVKALVENGIVGLVLWVLTLGGVISIAARARKLRDVGPWATAILAVAVSLTLVSFADNIQTAPVDMVYLFGLSGALAGVTLRHRARTPQRALALKGPEEEAAPVMVETIEEPAQPADPEPLPEPETEPVQRPASAAGLRSRVRTWLGRRSSR